MFDCVVDSCAGYREMPWIMILVTLIFLPSIVETDVPWLMRTSVGDGTVPAFEVAVAPREESKNFCSGPMFPGVILNSPPTRTNPRCRLARAKRFFMRRPPRCARKRLPKRLTRSRALENLNPPRRCNRSARSVAIFGV